MSKFYSKIRNVLKETELKRVKVTYMNGYIGYILEEDEEGAIVYITGGDDPEFWNQIWTLKPDQYEEESDQQSPVTSLDIIKELSLEYLQQKGLITCNDTDKIVELMSSPCIHTVEKYLRSMNITDSEILNLLKPAIT